MLQLPSESPFVEMYCLISRLDIVYIVESRKLAINYRKRAFLNAAARPHNRESISNRAACLEGYNLEY